MNASLVPASRHSVVREKILAMVEEYRVASRFPALGVGVVLDGDVVCCNTTGVSTVDSQRCAFGLGSASKVLVMAAVLNAADRQVIELGRPANDYLNRMRVQPPSRSMPAITVRQLLTHTGGLAPWRSRADLWRWGTGEVLGPGEPMPELTDFYGGTLRGYTAPGEQFVYSDHSYAVLGQVLADAEKTTVERAIEKNVLTPLGMTGTGLPPYAGMREPEPAYAPDGSRALPLRHVLVAPTSAVSSVRDMTLLLWALSHGGANPYGRLFGKEMAAQILRPAYRLHPLFPAMGMQLIVCGGAPTVGVMRGAYCGWVCWSAISEDLRAGVVLLGNRHGPLDQLGGRIVDALSGRTGTVMLGGPPHGSPSPLPAPLPASFRKAGISGVYAPLPREGIMDYSGEELAVSERARHGARLRTVWKQPNASRSLPLTPVPGQPDLYLLRYPWASLYVWCRRDSRGRVEELVLAPFDRFRRLGAWQIMWIPLRRLFSRLFAAVKWWAGSSTRRRLSEQAGVSEGPSAPPHAGHDGFDHGDS